ncbi:hypothetical protein RHO15_05935 [Utexia brackfieldae]|uniref:hypothetical protein n=1 Tax=Utexia brackfieldae TaxID=3074108 RepID=UPI00370D39A2
MKPKFDPARPPLVNPFWLYIHEWDKAQEGGDICASQVLTSQDALDALNYLHSKTTKKDADMFSKYPRKSIKTIKVSEKEFELIIQQGASLIHVKRDEMEEEEHAVLNCNDASIVVCVESISYSSVCRDLDIVTFSKVHL